MLFPISNTVIEGNSGKNHSDVRIHIRIAQWLRKNEAWQFGVTKREWSYEVALTGFLHASGSGRGAVASLWRFRDSLDFVSSKPLHN